MTEKEHKCSEVSVEELLLFAYGEHEDDRLESHINECELCRTYLSELEQVRGLADRAGLVSPADETMDRIMAEAKKSASARRGVLGRPVSDTSTMSRWKRLWPDLFETEIFPAWLKAPALVAAALVLIVSVVLFWSSREEQGKRRIVDRDTADIYADVSTMLSNLETDFQEQGGNLVGSDEFKALTVDDAYVEDEGSSSEEDYGLDPGALDLVFEPETESEAISSIELAMLDVERDMGLLGEDLRSELGSMGINDFIGTDRNEYEEIDLPLLPGLNHGMTF